jgi:hypothetical protein
MIVETTFAMFPYKEERPQLDGSCDLTRPFANGGRKGIGVLGIDHDMGLRCSNRSDFAIVVA